METLLASERVLTEALGSSGFCRDAEAPSDATLIIQSINM
jgi:hypothetical protein